MLKTYGWYALLLAILGDIFIPIVLSYFYKGYNSYKMSISTLGNPESPVRLLFNMWMFLEGTLFLLSLNTIHNYYDNLSMLLANIVTIFVFLFAVGACIFTSFFSVNITKDVVTTASKIHGIGSVVGFMVFLFVPLLLSILSFIDNDKFLGVISIVCFVVALFFFVLFVMADKPEFNGSIIANEGLWQRLNLLFMYIPFIILCIKNI